MATPAANYERFMVPVLFAPWAMRLIAQAQPKPSKHVIDIACGTGIVARQVAPLVRPNGSVTGLDASAEMLAVARTEACQAGRLIAWRQGMAERLPFSDGAFDLAFCQFALMFFEDRLAAASEMFRVLSGGGQALVSVFQNIEQHPFYVSLDEAIGRALGSSGVGSIFSFGEPAELKTLFVDAGFAKVSIEASSMTAVFPEPELFLAGEIEVDTAAIPAMQQLDADQRRALVAELESAMQGPLREVTSNGSVYLPFHVNIVVASKPN